MATPAQLMQTLCEATLVPLATIVDLDRRLVKAGFRSKAGRGLNAAKMTARDAAHLLTAVMTSSQGNMAVEAVERYRLTRCVGAPGERPYAASALADLQALRDHSFIEGLEALIVSSTSGAVATLVAKVGTDKAPRVEVFALTNATSGRIRLSGLPNRRTIAVDYVGRGNRPAAQAAGDLEQSRRITERTIFAVAALLAEEKTNG